MEHRRKKKPDIDPHAPGLGVSVAETLADLNWDDLPPDLVRNLKMFVVGSENSIHWIRDRRRIRT